MAADGPLLLPLKGAVKKRRRRSNLEIEYLILNPSRWARNKDLEKDSLSLKML